MKFLSCAHLPVEVGLHFFQLARSQFWSITFIVSMDENFIEQIALTQVVGAYAIIVKTSRNNSRIKPPTSFTYALNDIRSNLRERMIYLLIQFVPLAIHSCFKTLDEFQDLKPLPSHHCLYNQSVMTLIHNQ